MTEDRTLREMVPRAVRTILDRFRDEFELEISLWRTDGGAEPVLLHPEGSAARGGRESTVIPLTPPGGPRLEVQVGPSQRPDAEAVAEVLRTTLEEVYDFSREIRFFTSEVSERYEEINLLYSISDTLGSLLDLEEASRRILREVCDVMGARRGSLWVYDPGQDHLELVASVGEKGLGGPLAVDHPAALTAEAFREERPLFVQRDGTDENEEEGEPLVSRDAGAAEAGSALSVPIRYTPPAGGPRTVGVINLIGRRRGGRFTAADEKLLTAIATQVGAALENNRLVRESLERERVAREMELAHDLQMKLLPPVDQLDPARVGARVEPADSVGGDFYHCFRLPEGRLGVMIGDVSSHGFAASLIMALAMSAATIYASEVGTPSQVLEAMARALGDELESTEMYVTLFYGVLDPREEELVYANAGHPHAFVLRAEEASERMAPLDLPMGIGEAGTFQERRVPWSSGSDLLLLFTDGLSENLVEGDRVAGEARVVEEAMQFRDAAPQAIVDALFALKADVEGGTGIVDDRSALVVRA